MSNKDDPQQVGGRYFAGERRQRKALLSGLEISALLFIAAVVGGCSSNSSSEGDVTAIHDNLYVLTSELWLTHTVPVCWENDTTANATQRGWVQQQVSNSWSFAANIVFTDWGHCPTNSSQYVKIRIADTTAAPSTAVLGRAVAGVTDGVSLNFTFLNWDTGCQSTDEYCIRVIAAHEFGHVLGFAHEQNRPDTPASCTQPPQGQNGDTTFGAWDLSSIMDYCNLNWDNGGKLSGTDTAGVQKYYGLSGRFIAATTLGLNLL